MAQTRPSLTLSRGFTRLGRFLAPYAVADGYGVSVRTVAKWVQRFRQLGAAGLDDVPPILSST